jgi:hypothetical protein
MEQKWLVVSSLEWSIIYPGDSPSASDSHGENVGENVGENDVCPPDIVGRSGRLDMGWPHLGSSLSKRIQVL